MEPSLKKRIILVLGVLLIQSIYTPTSLFLTGGIEPKLPIDVFPLWVVWVIPYALCYPLWATALIWLTWKMDESMFRKTIAGLFFAIGFLVGLPESLIAGTAAVDFGGRAGASTASGFINGCGSVGAIFGGSLPGLIAKAWGWGALFSILGLSVLVAGLLLLPKWNALPAEGR